MGQRVVTDALGFFLVNLGKILFGFLGVVLFGLGLLLIFYVYRCRRCLRFKKMLFCGGMIDCRMILVFTGSCCMKNWMKRAVQ